MKNTPDEMVAALTEFDRQFDWIKPVTLRVSLKSFLLNRLLTLQKKTVEAVRNEVQELNHFVPNNDPHSLSHAEGYRKALKDVLALYTLDTEEKI